MTEPAVSVTITYHKPGTQPPLFVAGTFSDPQWEPQQMDCTTDEDGEHVFQKTVAVEPGFSIQYKFRVGEGDWWIVDESAPTTTDEHGNQNNILGVGGQSEPRETGADGLAVEAKPNEKVAAPQPRTLVDNFLKANVSRSGTSTPEFVRTAAEVADSAALLDKEEPEPEIPDEEAGRIGYRRLSSTPISQVADVAAEVADTAKTLDTDEPEIHLAVPRGTYRNLADAVKDDLRDDSLDLPATTGAGVPLFAHECLGLYEDDEIPSEAPDEDLGGHDDTEYDDENHGGPVNGDEEFDPNDPTLEKFPSNRDDIIDTVRKMETGLNEDTTAFEGIPVSPVVSARSNSITDFAFENALPPPVSPTLIRSRLGVPKARSSSTVSVSDRSASVLSLGSIAEAEEKDGDRLTLGVVAPIVERVATAEEAIEVAKRAEGEVNLPLERLTAAEIAPIAERSATAEDIINVARQIEGEAQLPTPSLSPATAAKTPVDGEEGPVTASTDEQNDASQARPERTGYLTPERAASPRPPTPGSPEEPAPNRAPPIPAIDTTNLGAARDPAYAGSTTVVPENSQAHSPKVVVHSAEASQPDGDILLPPAAADGAEAPSAAAADRTPDSDPTATDIDNAEPSPQLRKRAVQEAGGRTATPAALSEAGREAVKSGSWFRAFLRLVFIDWVGGIVSRLCGTRRKALLTTSTAVAATGMGVAWWRGYGGYGRGN